MLWALLLAGAAHAAEPGWFHKEVRASFVRHLERSPGPPSREILQVLQDPSFDLRFGVVDGEPLGVYNSNERSIRVQRRLLEDLGLCLGPKPEEPEFLDLIVSDIAPILAHEVYHAKVHRNVGFLPSNVKEDELLTGLWTATFLDWWQPDDTPDWRGTLWSPPDPRVQAGLTPFDDRWWELEDQVPERFRLPRRVGPFDPCGPDGGTERRQAQRTLRLQYRRIADRRLAPWPEVSGHLKDMPNISIFDRRQAASRAAELEKMAAYLRENPAIGMDPGWFESEAKAWRDDEKLDEAVHYFETNISELRTLYGPDRRSSGLDWLLPDDGRDGP